MNKKEELLKRLIAKTSQKSQGFKLFIWGIVLVSLNFLLSWFYGAIIYHGNWSRNFGFGEELMIEKLASFLEKNFFPTIFVVWIVMWCFSLFLLMKGLIKWFNAHIDIERVKLEL